MSLLDKASLIVTPNGYSEDTLYSVVPSSGAGDLSFTRATDAWRTNSAGLVQRVCWNLVQYSEQFENAAWTKIGSGLGTTPIVTSNFAIAPNGSLTADRVQCSNIGGSGAEGNYSLVLQSNIPLNASGTLSIYLKSLTGLTQNVLVYWAGGQGTVFQVTSQWQRFTIPNITPPTSGISLGTRGGVGWYTGGDAVIDIAVWGAQIVEGSSALEYFPTTDRQNVPRIDYSLGGCPTLLMEPQRTNLNLQSEDISGWIRAETTVVLNATAAPDGMITADSLLETTATGTHITFRDITGLSGTAYTFSIYAKSIGGRNIQLSGSSGFSGVVVVDLSNGNILSGSGVVSNVGNGWYRISITATTTTTAIRAIVYTVNGASNSYTGDVTKGVSLWGAQLEVGAYPTSYIPTTTASVTRNADVATKLGISSLLGQTEGTVLYSINNPFVGSGVQFIGSVSNDALSSFYSSYLINGRIQFDFYPGGVYTHGMSSPVALPLGVNKYAVVYKAGAYKLFLNGVLVSTNSNATPITNTISRITLNPDVSPIYFQSVVAFKSALSDSELELLTGNYFDSYAKMAAFYNYTLQ